MSNITVTITKLCKILYRSFNKPRKIVYHGVEYLLSFFTYRPIVQLYFRELILLIVNQKFA